MSPSAILNASSASTSQPQPQTSQASPVDEAIFVSVTVLQQAVDFLNKSLTNDEQLTQRSKLIPGSTIGKHLRHAAEHYALLLQSISNSGPVNLSYDVRSRNTPMETSITEAISVLTALQDKLKKTVPKVAFEEHITLEAVTPFLATMNTTFGRELWFTSLHAIHHWSMVRVVAGEMGIECEHSFGVAPSTLTYRKQEAPLGDKAKI